MTNMDVSTTLNRYLHHDAGGSIGPVYGGDRSVSIDDVSARLYHTVLSYPVESYLTRNRRSSRSPQLTQGFLHLH